MALLTPFPRTEERETKTEPRTEPPQEPGSRPAPAPVRHMEEQRSVAPTAKLLESVLSAGLTIEGKIEGTGNVRIAGRFKGPINVKGEVTVEPGASIDGEVTAGTVVVGGEVRGKIVASSRVEFKGSGTLVGDLTAGTLIVAAGSKMRGNVTFGWKEGETADAPLMTGGQSLNL
jgi:cytoskeletal protein CcmA (bactofilin family)